MIGHKIWNSDSSLFTIIEIFCLLIRPSCEEKLNHGSYSYFKLNARNDEAVHHKHDKENYNFHVTPDISRHLTTSASGFAIPSTARTEFQTGKHSVNKQYSSLQNLPMHYMRPNKCSTVSELFLLELTPFIPRGQKEICFGNNNYQIIILNDLQNVNHLRFKRERLENTKIEMVFTSALHLRNSLLILFTDILYTFKGTLTQTEYSAFFKICESLRKRKADIFELLNIIPKIKYLPLKQQLVVLAQRMKHLLPKHLIPSVSICVNVLLANKIETILPRNYLNGRNIFSSLNLGVKEGAILHVLKSSALSRTSETFINRISLGIAKGEIPLSCNIFTGIMLNLPLEGISPEILEAQLFIRDTLSHEKEFCLNSISRIPIALSEPYSLVHSVLKSILKNINLSFSLRECANIILPHIYLPYSHSEYRNIIREESNLKQLLTKVVTVTEFPQDIVYTKERILSTIRSSYIDYTTNVHSFYYVSPTEKLISKLEQLRRQEGISKHTLRHIKVLRSHLIFKAKQWFHPHEFHKRNNYFQIQLLLGSLLNPLLFSMNNLHQYLESFIYKNKPQMSKQFTSQHFQNNTLREAAALILDGVKTKLQINAKYLNYIEKYLAEYKCFYASTKQIYTDNGIIQPMAIQLIILDFSSSHFLSETWLSLVNSALQDLSKTSNKALYWSTYYCLKYSSFTLPLFLNSSHLTSFKLLQKLIKYSVELRIVQENPYLLHSFSFYYSLMNPGKNFLANVPLTVLDIKVMLSYIKKNNIKYFPRLQNIASVCSPRLRLLPKSYFTEFLTIDTFLEILKAMESNYWKSHNFLCVVEKLKKLGSLGKDSLLAMQNIQFDNVTLILEYLPKLKYKNVYTLILNFMTPENMSKFDELSFNPMKYTTPTLYLYHCIVTVLRGKLTGYNSNLIYALRFYKVYIEYELQMFVETVNTESILRALPKTEDKGLQAVKKFLTLPKLKMMLSPIFQMKKFQSAHSLLQNVVKHIETTNNVHLDPELAKDLKMYTKVICFCSKTYLPIPNILLNVASEVEDLKMKDSEKWEILHSFLVQPELLTILGIPYDTLCNFDYPNDMLLNIVDKALKVEALQNDALLIDALTQYKTLSANKSNSLEIHEHYNMSHMNQAIHNLPILSYEKYCELMTLYVKSNLFNSIMSNISHKNEQPNTEKLFIKELQNYYSPMFEEKHNQNVFPACRPSLLLQLMISELPVLSTSKIKQDILNFLSSYYMSNVLQNLNLSQIVNPKPNVELFVTRILQTETIVHDLILNEAMLKLRNLFEIKRLSAIIPPDEAMDNLIPITDAAKETDDETICKLISNSSLCLAPDIQFDLLKLSIKNLKIEPEVLQSNKDLWQNIFDSQVINKYLTLCNTLSIKNSELVFSEAMHKNLASLYNQTSESMYGSDPSVGCLLQFCLYQNIIPKCYLKDTHNITDKNSTSEKDKYSELSTDSTLKDVIIADSMNNLTFNNRLNNSKDLNTTACSSAVSILSAPHEISDSSTNIQRYIPQLLKIKDIKYPLKIKNFLENPHLSDLFGTSLNISQYYTPILKLAAIIRYAKTVNDLQKDKEFLDNLKLFEKVLEKKYAEIAIDEEDEKFNINMHPNSTDEDKLWHVHRFFIQQPLSVIFGELFSSRSFPTEKDKLRAITEHVMSLGSVQFKVEWYEAFDNFNRSLEKHQPPPPPPFPVTALPDFARLMEKIPEVPNSDIHLPVFAAVLTYPNIMNILGSRFNVYEFPTPILKLWAIIKTYEESSMKFIYENVMQAMDKYKTALNNMIARAPNKFILDEMSDVLEMTNNEKLLRITDFLMSNNTVHMAAIRTHHKSSPKQKLQRLLEHVMFLDSTQLNPKVYYSLDSFLNLLNKNMDSPVPPVVIENFPDIIDIFPNINDDDDDDDQYFPVIVGLLTKPDIIKQATHLNISPVKTEQEIVNLKFQAMLNYGKSKITDRGLIKYIEKCETALEENFKYCT